MCYAIFDLNIPVRGVISVNLYNRLYHSQTLYARSF